VRIANGGKQVRLEWFAQGDRQVARLIKRKKQQ
jgi:YD repeat-containing protein